MATSASTLVQDRSPQKRSGGEEAGASPQPGAGSPAGVPRHFRVRGKDAGSPNSWNRFFVCMRDLNLLRAAGGVPCWTGARGLAWSALSVLSALPDLLRTLATPQDALDLGYTEHPHVWKVAASFAAATDEESSLRYHYIPAASQPTPRSAVISRICWRCCSSVEGSSWPLRCALRREWGRFVSCSTRRRSP